MKFYSVDSSFLVKSISAFRSHRKSTRTLAFALHPLHVISKEVCIKSTNMVSDIREPAFRSEDKSK